MPVLRRPSSNRRRWILFVGLSACLFPSNVWADDRPCAALLPAHTIVCVQVEKVGEWLPMLLDSRLAKQLIASPEVQRGLEKPDAQKALGILKYVETRIEMPWHKAVQTLAAQGAAFAVDHETSGAALILKAESPEALNQLHAVVVELVRLQAAVQGKKDPYQEQTYRDVKWYQVEKTAHALVGPFFVLSNEPEFCKRIVDRFLEPEKQSLVQDKDYLLAQTMARRSGAPCATAFVRVDVLRSFGLAPKLFDGKSPDPMAELLIGGLKSIAQHTPWLSASLRVSPVDQAADRRLELSVSTPFAADWVPKSRTFYFGEAGLGAAPPAIQLPDALFTASAYRDTAAMWQSAQELFNDQVLNEMAKSESNLGLFFGGRDFGREVLGAFGPEIQIVAARQTFAPAGPSPSIKLPAAALVLRLKDSEKSARSWKTTFQSIIGFVNVAGVQNGFPPLEMEMKDLPNGFMVGTRHLIEDEQRASLDGKINFNFTPALAVVGDRFILSSGSPLCRSLVETKPTSEASAETSQPSSVDNLRLHLHLPSAAAALRDNQPHLLAQNMLEKGHTEAEAQREVDVLFQLLELVESSSLRLVREADELRLHWSIDAAAIQK